MNIALIGYGKMGKTIEGIARQRGHRIVATSSSSNPVNTIDFSEVDVAIEFTAPHLAVGHIAHCLGENTPIVVGTTAWGAHLEEVKTMVEKHDGSLLYASNFSIGVNMFFDLNRRLAQLMNRQDSYMASIEEIHHLQKLDAPSGTAISLANDILANADRFSRWVHEAEASPQTKSNEIALTSYRKDGVPGTHTITYSSSIDTLEMTHTAHNREGFALGAVVAAEWLFGKKGVYTMQDVIKL
jgi:4-hydroxy-tetrahydrodipicolinate reductase